MKNNNKVIKFPKIKKHNNIKHITIKHRSIDHRHIKHVEKFDNDKMTEIYRDHVGTAEDRLIWSAKGFIHYCAQESVPFETAISFLKKSLKDKFSILKLSILKESYKNGENLRDFDAEKFLEENDDLF